MVLSVVVFAFSRIWFETQALKAYIFVQYPLIWRGSCLVQPWFTMGSGAKTLVHGSVVRFVQTVQTVLQTVTLTVGRNFTKQHKPLMSKVVLNQETLMSTICRVGEFLRTVSTTVCKTVCTVCTNRTRRPAFRGLLMTKRNFAVARCG